MNVVNRTESKRGLLSTASSANRLSLYDQYGAVAYGVILKIVPQQQQAQELLIDLFASSELQTSLPSSTSAICMIVRLARAKALAYRKKQQLPVLVPTATAKQAEHIFDLMFCHDQSPDSIAERLQIPRSDVFVAVREFFAYHLPS